MATPAEVFNHDEDKRRAPLPGEDTIGNETPVVALIEGEYRTYYSPGNFPAILDIRINELSGLQDEEEERVAKLKEYLRDTPVGRQVCVAVDRALYDPELSQLIIEARSEETGRFTREYRYAQLVDKVAKLLPPGVDARALKDAVSPDDPADPA